MRLRLLSALNDGVVLVTVDPSVVGTKVPLSLRALGLVQLRLSSFDPDLVLDNKELRVTLSVQGKEEYCILPYLGILSFKKDKP